MASSEFQFHIEICSMAGDLLRRSLLAKPDWLPADEAVRWQSLVQERTPASEVRIFPVFHRELGTPHVTSISATTVDAFGAEISVAIPLQFFLPYAQDVAAELVDEAILADGQQYLYMLKAYATSELIAPTTNALGMTVSQEIESPISGERNIAQYERLASGCEGDGVEPFPVFVPESVLEQAMRLKDEAGGVETGGFLIGYVFRDPSTRQLFTDVTALIPARHTVAASTKLTFTRESWADLNAAIALRGRGESIVAWVHSHPAAAWCKCSDVESLKNCPYSRQFFSRDDCALHRTVFWAAQQTAIVLGDRYGANGWETAVSAYGWSNAVIEPRAFRVTRAAPAQSQSGASHMKEAEVATTCI